jgi:hypothetical protein
MSNKSAGRAYLNVHYVARKLLSGEPCTYCGSTTKIEAALRPDTPAERLIAADTTGWLYSLNPYDYFALCLACHRRLDTVELRPGCRRGHEYTPSNTSIKPDGSRRCLACHRDGEARRMEGHDYRIAKRLADRGYRARHPMTTDQKARKVALQRLRRQFM